VQILILHITLDTLENVFRGCNAPYLIFNGGNCTTAPDFFDCPSGGGPLLKYITWILGDKSFL
jgi:hypothetical protein